MEELKGENLDSKHLDDGTLVAINIINDEQIKGFEMVHLDADNVYKTVYFPSGNIENDEYFQNLIVFIKMYHNTPESWKSDYKLADLFVRN